EEVQRFCHHDAQQRERLRNADVRPEVRAVAFRPDGRRILTACYDGNARLWDPSTGEELRRFPDDPQNAWDMLRTAAFAPDGSTIVTGGWRGGARLWDGGGGRARAVGRG